MSIDFACPKCNKKYKVKDELAGKTAKCAKCKNRIKIPVPVTPEAIEPEPDLSDLFDDDFSAATSGVVVDAVPNNLSPTEVAPNHSTKVCPSCGSELSADAVLCVDCGFDLRSRSHHEMQKLKPRKRKSKAAQEAATLMQGVAFSAMGAVLGAIVWVGVVIITDYEIGWIAWGLGAATGAGMALGKGDDTGEFSGIIAAAMAIVGILGAKFGIYLYLLASIEAAGMTLQQVEAIAGERLTFGSLFGLIDGLFILLAVISAYKIGSGQSSD